MQIVTIPSETVYSNLYTLSGISTDSSIIITNNTSDPCFIIRSVNQPSASALGYPVRVGKTLYIPLVTGETIWIRGDTGPLIVQEVGTAFGDYRTIDLPPYLYTDPDQEFRRLKVEEAATGFYKGLQFRSYFNLSIGAGLSQTFKFNASTDFILRQQQLAVDVGSIRFTATINATETGTFSTVLPIFGKNRMSTAPITSPGISITTGGSFTGGIEAERFSVIAATATAQQATVGPLQGSERGLPAGVFFLRFTNFGQGTAEGTYTLFWEEFP